MFDAGMVLSKFDRFNLSILECKYRQRCVYLQTWFRFNLSILECKFIQHNQRVQCLDGFNLSILECKSLSLPCFCAIRSVLIYPYWNVNVLNQWFGAAGLQVLIYPYWNVNSSFYGSLPVQLPGFNLSILECKFYRHVLNNSHRKRFNLSILECKLNC